MTSTRMSRRTRSVTNEELADRNSGGAIVWKTSPDFSLTPIDRVAEADLGHASSFDLADEVGKRHDRRFRGAADEVIGDSQGRNQGAGDEREEKSRPAKVR